MTADPHSSPNPLRLFTLDLLYPAVLGSMMVLLFLRLANFGQTAWIEATTIFGVVLAIYYALGFVIAKLAPTYSPLLALLDCVSSLLIFICFFILGFNEQQIPGTGGGQAPVNYQAFYWLLIVVSLSGPLRRKLSVGKVTLFEFRTVVALLGVALAGIGLFQWLTPRVIAISLLVLVGVYIVDLVCRGVKVANR
jgi:hypothetical protein